MLTSNVAGQTAGTVTGRITDADTGEPLPGANVLVEGTNLGAATDIDGEYVVTGVPSGTQIIVVEYIGYASVTRTVEIQAGGTRSLDIAIATAPIVAEMLVSGGPGGPEAPGGLITLLALIALGLTFHVTFSPGTSRHMARMKFLRHFFSGALCIWGILLLVSMLRYAITESVGLLVVLDIVYAVAIIATTATTVSEALAASAYRILAIVLIAGVILQSLLAGPALHHVTSVLVVFALAAGSLTFAALTSSSQADS